MPVVTVSESAAASQHEDLFVKAFLSMVSSDDYKKVLKKVEQCTNEQGFAEYRISLVLVQKRQSITWYFICKTLAGLEHLKYLYESEQLTTMFEEIINCVLNIKESHHLTVEWNYSEYERCKEQLTHWSSSSQLTLASSS